MNAHVKFNNEQSLAIARAIFSGASHSQVSKDYGVSINYVMAQVEKLRREIAHNASRSASVPANRNVIPMEPTTERKLSIRPLQSAVGLELGIVAIRQGSDPSMPYVSILHGGRA